METARYKRETGIRLKKLRISLGYTQEMFAEILNISVTLYKKMENGNYNISIKTLRKLKEVSGVSVDYIMFGEKNEFGDIWNLLLNSENKTKLKVLLRLLLYFENDCDEKFTESRQELRYLKILEKVMDKDEL